MKTTIKISKSDKTKCFISSLGLTFLVFIILGAIFLTIFVK